MKSVTFNPLTSLVMAAALAIGLAACGGSSTTPDPMPPEPTPYEMAMTGIAAAVTAEAAQAAFDAVKDDVTAAQGARLQAAVDARVEALETMAGAAEQKMALTTAAGNIDTSDLSTQAAIDAAETAIAALEAALAMATDVSDADKAMYQGRVTAAETAVASAQSALNHDAQTMALSDAVSTLQAIDLSDLSTQAAIDEAEAAIAALRMALDAAVELSAAEKTAAMTELATASRTVMAAQGSFDSESQMTVLADAVAALKMVDLDDLMTRAQIDAANEAIIALDLALAAATNLTDAQKLDALTDVTLAKRKVTAAETVLAENVGSQRMALTEAGTALAAVDLSDLDTAEKIAAANEAIEALKMALANATHLSDVAKAMYQTQLDTATETVRTAQTGMDRDGRMMAQRSAIDTAVTAARTAVAMVDDDATDAQVTAADDAVAALKAAIDAAVDLSGDTEVAVAQGTLDTLVGQLASAKTSRMVAMEAEETEENKAMAATAATLYDAIAPASGDQTTEATTARAAEIVASATGGSPTIGINFAGGAADTESRSSLVLDKDTTVADHRGWEGNRYVEKDSDGNIITEAVVYSDEMPTMGKKFGSAAAVTETGDFEYQLDSGMYTVDGTDGDNDPLVGGSGFDQSAGIKEFALPSPNPTGATMVTVPGTFHGVSGTYSCTPGNGNTCAANKAATGFTLGLTADADNEFTSNATAWTFKPANPNARVTEGADMLYAVYGWWLRTPAGGGAWVASAFDSYHAAAAPAFTGLDALNGSATYTGGAAGKYALASSTGGENDAGHFTARATLEADFDTDTITGTIDDFMGDGEAKDWSVSLQKSGVSDAGAIAGDGTDGNVDLQKTVWTIGDDAAAASGQWRGQFQEVDDTTDVPKVVTGDFYTEFGNSGKMVGGFGAKTQ